MAERKNAMHKTNFNRGGQYIPCIASNNKSSLITAAIFSNGYDLRPQRFTEQPHLQNTLVGSFRFMEINGMINYYESNKRIIDFNFYKSFLGKNF